MRLAGGGLEAIVAAYRTTEFSCSFDDTHDSYRRSGSVIQLVAGRIDDANSLFA